MCVICGLQCLEFVKASVGCGQQQCSGRKRCSLLQWHLQVDKSGAGSAQARQSIQQSTSPKPGASTSICSYSGRAARYAARTSGSLASVTARCA